MRTAAELDAASMQFDRSLIVLSRDDAEAVAIDARARRLLSAYQSLEGMIFGGGCKVVVADVSHSFALTYNLEMHIL